MSRSPHRDIRWLLQSQSLAGSALGPGQRIAPRTEPEKTAPFVTSATSSLASPPAFPQLIPFDLPAIKEDPPQEKPTDNQMLAEVITEQANFSVSAARSSKVLYVITTSTSHPRQTVPGSCSKTPSKG